MIFLQPLCAVVHSTALALRIILLHINIHVHAHEALAQETLEHYMHVQVNGIPGNQRTIAQRVDHQLCS